MHCLIAAREYVEDDEDEETKNVKKYIPTKVDGQQERDDIVLSQSKCFVNGIKKKNHFKHY